MHEGHEGTKKHEENPALSRLCRAALRAAGGQEDRRYKPQTIHAWFVSAIFLTTNAGRRPAPGTASSAACTLNVFVIFEPSCSS